VWPCWPSGAPDRQGLLVRARSASAGVAGIQCVSAGIQWASAGIQWAGRAKEGGLAWQPGRQDRRPGPGAHSKGSGSSVQTSGGPQRPVRTSGFGVGQAAATSACVPVRRVCVLLRGCSAIRVAGFFAGRGQKKSPCPTSGQGQRPFGRLTPCYAFCVAGSATSAGAVSLSRISPPSTSGTWTIS